MSGSKFVGMMLIVLCFILPIPSAHAADGPAGPGWMDVQGSLVTPQEAGAHYQPISKISVKDVAPKSATTLTTEITALARALKNDPRLIYEYVRNNVDYVPYFGSLKGATLTYLEGCGNDFDQSSLMIALLQASGYTNVRYVYGQMTIPLSGDPNLKDMQHWLGIDANNSVISKLFANGGIPASQSGSNWIVNRVWVQLTISNNIYLFDPAFKPHQVTQAINLQAAMVYSKSGLFSAAGGSSGTDYVQNLNETSLRNTLDGYTLSLADFIRSNYPNAQTSELIGGSIIVPQTLTVLPTSLDFTTSNQVYWADIPDNFIHKVTIQHGGINQPLNIPDLAGQKLSIVYRASSITTSSALAKLVTTDTQSNPTAFVATKSDYQSTESVPAGDLDATLPDFSLPVVIVDKTKSTYKTVASTSPVDFGTIYPASVGTSSNSITFGPITNSYSIPVQIVVTLTSNPDSAYAIITGSGTTTLTAGQTINILMVAKFSNTGQTTGTKTGQIKIQWQQTNGTAIGNPAYYNLTGYVANAPDLTGSDGFNFGTPYLANPVDGAVRLKNSGSLSLSITGVTLTDTDAARFQITGGNQAGSLSNSQYRDINIRYLANSVGTHSAKANVTYKYDGLTYSINLKLLGQTLSPLVAQLWLDDQMLVEETEPIIGTNLNTMTISVTHPYTSTFANQSTPVYTLKRGSTYAIVYDFGGSRLGRVLEKRERQMQTYRESGLADTTRQVLTESLNVIGMTWMRDTTLNANLLSQIAGTLDLRHHRFGIVAQESGYYIDVKTQFSSTTSRHGNTDATKAYIKASSHLASAMEHGVFEQMQSNSPALSTVKLLQLNNAVGKKLFRVDKNNFTTIKSQLLNYTDQDLADLQSRVNSGSTLILPENGKIALQTWAGKGYIDYNFNSAPYNIGMIIDGGYNGGYGAIEAPLSIAPVTTQVNLNISPPATIPKIGSLEPVDMATGFWMFNNTDLTLSGGAGGLSVKRSYNSGNNNMKDSLGYGWSHNYHLFVEPHSSSPYGLGQRQPLDAAAMIVASVATLDVMNASDLKSWTVGALIGKWGMDNLTNNAASVHLGSDVLTFVKLPDGSFASPPGVTSKLVMNGNLYRVDERFNRTVNFGSDNNASSMTDADGNAVNFTYSVGKLQSVSDNFGHSLTFSYTGNLLTSVADNTGRNVSYGYDTNNNLTTYTDPEGKIWTYGYDANHRVQTMKNPLNIITVTNVYDTFGQVQSQTMPRQTGTTTYNLYFSGYRNIEEDSNGHQTIYFFDEQKHLLGVQNALGQRNVKNYDGQSHVVSETDPNGNVTGYTFDGNNNPTTVTNPFNKQTTNIYDSQYHLTDMLDPLGHLTHNDYDTKHHPIKTTIYPTSSQPVYSQKSYYANGLVNTSTDARKVVTTLTQDSQGNPATSKTSTAPAITYVYDSIGRIKSLTDQEGAKTLFSYDKRSLLTGSTDPLNKNVSLTYYDDGTLWTKTDRNGRATTFTYTPTGKTNSIAYSGGSTVSFTYNQNDNLTKIQDSLGATTYGYDNANRLTGTTAPWGFAIGYDRDANGNITKITYPDNKTVSYTFDALNQVKTVSIDWLGKTASYNYDDAGRMTDLTQFNGTYTRYTYDDANRLTALENRLSNAGSPIATYAYTLDNNGNRTNITQNVPINLNAIASNTNFTMSLQKNRLSQAGNTSFTYDNEGQLATKSGSIFTFDDAHRLTNITGAVNFQFKYDGAGNRLEATRNNVVTRYVYDASGNLLAETDGSNAIQKYYIYGAGFLATVTSSNQLYCYHFDGTGNTVALTDASANVVNKYAYTPFGAITNQQEAIAQPFKYVGKYGVMTEPNGLYYMKARYYDPQVGRFISEDPLGFGGGDVNLMAYVGNQPVNGIDPSGLINTELLSQGFRNLTAGGVLAVGGALLTGSSGGFGAVVGVGSAIYGAEMAGRGVVQMATGLIQNNPVSIPNPSITYNASYALTKSHQAADFTYNTSSLLLGAASAGATPSMSSLEAVYNALDTGMTLHDTFSGMKGCGR